MDKKIGMPPHAAVEIAWATRDPQTREDYPFAVVCANFLSLLTSEPRSRVGPYFAAVECVRRWPGDVSTVEDLPGTANKLFGADVCSSWYARERLHFIEIINSDPQLLVETLAREGRYNVHCLARLLHVVDADDEAGNSAFLAQQFEQQVQQVAQEIKDMLSRHATLRGVRTT